MAETSFGQTSHRGVARAEVRVAATDIDATRVTERADATTYNPLTNPDAPNEHGFSPPAPIVAPATEEQLREVLGECIASREFAANNHERAIETATRAMTHREQCEIRLRDFHDLDERITQATIDGLRTGRGRPMHDDDPLRHLVVERTIARDDLAAAVRAEAVLAKALEEATREHDASVKAANVAAASLSMLVAEQLAMQIHAHEAEAIRLRDILHGADIVGVVPPKLVRDIYGDGQRFLRPVDKAPWLALRERLLNDPQAPLELEGV